MPALLRARGRFVRALVAILLSAAALAAHPARLRAQPPVLDRVEISGNRRVEEEAIRVRLRMRPGVPFDEASVDADVKSLFAMGFFDDVRARLERRDGEWVLTYEVDERPFIERVEIDGARRIDEQDIEEALGVRPNTILDPERLRKGIREVRKLYEKKGYLDAEVSYETRPAGEGRVTLLFHIDEKRPVRIHTIRFEGNRAFRDRQLARLMQTRERWFLSFLTGAGTIDREVLKADVERLTAFYYEHGYIDVRIDDPVVERDDKGLIVTIRIEEGAPYTFGKIQLEGDILPEAREMLAEMQRREGKRFRASRLREDINALTDLYGDRGYAFVNVTPETEVDPRAHVVDVTYRIDQGPEVYVDRIEISGNTKTRDKVIRRELELAEQQRFSGSKLRRSQEKIRRLGFFSEVNVTTRKSDRPDRLDVVVDVKEGPTGAFSAGAGISSGESFLFNLRLSEINFLGRGQRVVLNLDFGAISRNFSLSFTEPYLMDTRLTLGVDAFNWELIFSEFTRSGTGGSIRTLYPFEALGWRDLWGIPLVDTRFGLDYRIERASITDVSRSAASIIRAERGTSLTSSLTPRLFRDTRNHPFDPTAGSLQDLSLEIAGLGGDSHFLKLESRARWYLPFWESERLGTFTFSTGWNFGYGVGYAGEKELPLFERYFPGGINTVRGYDVRSLGPRVPVFDQVPENARNCPLGANRCARLIRRDEIGGSQQLIFNNEIIVPIVQALGLKGVLFFDAGEAFLASEGIDLSELRTAVGFGFRWLSPIGPLRIEIGFPLNRRPGDDRQAIAFSFGGPP